MGLQQMSFSASMMIAFIILIRCAAINRLCKKTFMVLWAAVVARLIVPFNLPSRLSVYSLAENLAGFVKGLIYTKPLETAPAVFIKTAAVNEQSGISVWSVVWFAGAVLAVVWFVSVYVRCKREFDISLPAERQLD